MVWIRRGVQKPPDNVLHLQLTPEQISVDLKSDFMCRLEQDEELQRIQDKREAFPVKNFESEVLDAIHHNSVVVIRGATGCGKTTQVPQYILDECLFLASSPAAIIPFVRRSQGLGPLLCEPQGPSASKRFSPGHEKMRLLI